jgi:hypothetical protein
LVCCYCSADGSGFSLLVSCGQEQYAQGMSYFYATSICDGSILSMTGNVHRSMYNYIQVWLRADHVDGVQKHPNNEKT